MFRNWRRKCDVFALFFISWCSFTRDILGEINKASENHPNLKIKIANYFGSRNEIAEILMKTALDIK